MWFSENSTGLWWAPIQWLVSLQDDRTCHTKHSEWTVSAKADRVRSYTDTTKAHQGLLAATRSYESQASILGPLVEVQPCWHSDFKLWPLELREKNMYCAVSQSSALVKLQEAGFSSHWWARKHARGGAYTDLQSQMRLMHYVGYTS